MYDETTDSKLRIVYCSGRNDISPWPMGAKAAMRENDFIAALLDEYFYTKIS